MEVKRGAPGGEAALDFERSPTQAERAREGDWIFLLQGSSSATVDCQLSTTAPKTTQNTT